MTVQQHNVARTRLFEEPNVSFAVDHSGTMGDFIDCPIREGTGTLTLGLPTETPGHLQQHIDGYPEEVLLPKEWQFDYEINLETVDTKAGDGVTIAQGALGRMLKIGMGDERLGVGDTVNDAGATTTVIIMTTIARWLNGSAMGFNTGTGGSLEMRVIESISGSTVTLKEALTAGPANSAVVFNAATYSMGLGNGDVVTSAQFALEGLEQDDRWLCMGGQLASITFELGPGTIPKVIFSWKGVDWDVADGVATAGTLTGSVLASSTYADNQTLVVKDSEFRFRTLGTTTFATSDVSSITITPNLVYVSQRTPGAVETVARWIRDHQPSVVSGSFMLPYEGQMFWLARANRTNHAIQFQIGTSITEGGILLDIPTVQVTDVQRVNDNGIAAQQVSWKARLDEETTGTDTDLNQSAFRIHLI